MVIIGISGSEQEFNKCVLKKEGFHLGSSIAATFVRSNSFVLKSVSCVTFFSERLEPNIFIPHALGRAILKSMEDNSRFFCLGRKKRTRTEFTKKNTLSQRAVSYFFTTEAAEVKRAGGNEKIARFDRSDRSIVINN